MDRFVKSLKEMYKKRVFFTEKQWLRVSGDKLINLQLVEADKKEGFCGGLPQDSVKERTVKRTRIVCENLFKGEKPVNKVLVEGNGGMGKTTLCTMITEGWAEEKMLTQFECIVFLPLREKDVASAKSIADLLRLLHSSKRICASVLSHLEDTLGKGLLIVADGWDELGESKRYESSFLYQLLFCRVLPFASVLLTSRPSASADLHSLPCVDRLVEVVGFNEDNIKQYIEYEFEECPEKASGLIEQLANNPVIQSVCAVPLNCAITCNLWHTLDQQLPTTLTELYTLIILNVILWNIRKLPDFQNKLSLKSFNFVPSKLEQYLWLTCKFAFETLSRDQLVFTEEEVASLFPEGFESSQQFLYFGLLQSAHSLLPVGHGLSFHFLHLTFQEYLAALHVVTLPIEEQMEVVKEYGSTSRFEMVWRFFFGLGSDNHSVHSEHVSKKVVCLDEKVLQIFLSLSLSNFFLCHCALESRDEMVSYRIANSIDGDFYACNDLHDYVAVLHVLSHTSHCENINFGINGLDLTDKLLDRLTDILSSARGKLKVSMLWLGFNMLTGRGVSDLFNKASVAFSSLVAISLAHNGLDGDSVESIVSTVIHTSSKYVAYLSLSDNPLGVSGIQALERVAVAGVLVNLMELELCNTLTSDCDTNGALLTTLVASLSSHCPHLEDLDLSENNLGKPGVFALGKSLALLTIGKSNLSFKLKNTMLDGEAISSFTDYLKSSSKLTTSESLIYPNGSQSQSESLSIPTEYTLSLNYNPLTFSGALALLRLLSSDTCRITSLKLKNTDIATVTNSDSLVVMFVLAPRNHFLNRLCLSSNNLSGERVHLLVKFMYVCQSLEYLDCTDCKLTSEDILQVISLLMSKCLTGWYSKLMVWILCDNNIDDVGAAALVKCKPDLFPSLGYVYLFCNPVSDEMIKQLNECLKIHHMSTDSDVLSRVTEDGHSLSPTPTVPEPSTNLLPPSFSPITPNDQMSASESSSVCPVVESPVRLAPQGPERSETDDSSLDIDLETVDNSTELDADDVSAMTGELSGLAPMYMLLGYALGFDHSVMETISYDFRNDRCLNALTQVIVEWLKQNYNFQKFGKPSWKNLVKALCHPTMRDEPGLAMQRAKEIAKKYPRH